MRETHRREHLKSVVAESAILIISLESTQPPYRHINEVTVLTPSANGTSLVPACNDTGSFGVSIRILWLMEPAI
jgi:hypothetical protein